jgi:hypothetical protein
MRSRARSSICDSSLKTLRSGGLSPPALHFFSNTIDDKLIDYPTYTDTAYTDAAYAACGPGDRALGGPDALRCLRSRPLRAPWAALRGRWRVCLLADPAVGGTLLRRSSPARSVQMEVRSTTPSSAHQRG